MKIKYSNRIRSQIPSTFLKELVTLSCSTVPYQPVHFFDFEDTRDGELCVIHNTLGLENPQKIIMPYRKHPLNTIILIKRANVFYLCFQDEIIN